MEYSNKIFNCDECLFKVISCQYIKKEEFEKLQTTTTQLRFKKGEVILKQGLKANHLVFLLKGSVKFNYENENEKNLILTISKAPALIGSANIFNEGLNLFSVTAFEDCNGCLIDINILKKIALNNSTYVLKLLEIILGMFRISIFNFISLAHKQVHGRVADILIYFSQNIYQSSEFTLAQSRQEIAEFAGCSKENVIHTLRKFHEEGIIKIKGKKINILDFDKLLQISKVG